MTCDQTLGPSGKCVNHWCLVPPDQRYFDVIFAIAMRSGALQNAINRYKYDDKFRWAAIFGRVLVGYLEQYADIFDDLDIVTGSPTYTGEGARRSWDHIGRILEAAGEEAGNRWPFDLDSPRVIIKTGDTEKLTGKPLVDRRIITQTQLRDALQIPEPARLRDANVVVFDDVFTDGSTLREVARALKLAGARRVVGIVLARQPWQY
jgi:predicted amidophosphoribosyltransferase